MGNTRKTLPLLLVEDEPRLQVTIARSLEVRGYEIARASSAGEAMAALAAEQFSAILLDINLPDATGWDVLRSMTESGNTTPVIVMSAVPPNPERVRQFRPCGVLMKPFPIDALLQLVRAACGEPDQVETKPGPEMPLPGRGEVPR